jgi:hypothetical protein
MTSPKAQTRSNTYEVASSWKPGKSSAYVSFGMCLLTYNFATRRHAGVPPVPVVELGRPSQDALDAAYREDLPA